MQKSSNCESYFARALYFALDRSLDDRIHFLLNWHVEAMLLVRSSNRFLPDIDLIKIRCRPVGCRFLQRMHCS